MMEHIIRVVILCLGLSLFGCSTTHITEVDSMALPPSYQAMIGELVQRRQPITTQLEDDELSWYATEQMTLAAEQWQLGDQQFQIFRADPVRMNEQVGMFSKRSRYQITRDGYSNAELALERAQQIRIDAAHILATAFNNREVLDSLVANKHFPDDYRDVEQQLKRLVDLIASDEADQAGAQLGGLVSNQNELEVATVRAIYAATLELELERLQDDEIDEAAPRSYIKAKNRLDNLIEYASQQPRKLETVWSLAEETRLELEHCRQIGEAIQHLDDASNRQKEKFLLSLEKQLEQLAHQMEQVPQRQRDLLAQLQQLNRRLKELLNQYGEQ
ncbi:hypothetical protein [Ferrimonas lipolytica]|uniref:Uncharacterized protein n=1 Tax=Ferrimonas lipolytica TaxID=2724191 RepID=A0A6H1UEB7_9GAMM|nr:hypothetical protein [Ferrimonas lipolytica]QIZ77435.1 hypothetical protein HER31_11400 [Ferrimonas lipolytica]